MVSEVSVHGQSLPHFWVQDEAEHHGSNCVMEQSCSPHGSQEAESESKGRGLRAHDITFKFMPLMAYFLQLDPTI
jgi:hypothetical protein